MNPDLVVVDISHYQSVSSFDEVAAAGVVGVILKATEGTTYVDAEYAGFRRRAEAAGLAVATYHYLHHGSIVEQMDHYLKTVDPDPGERVCIDYEDIACTLDDLRQAIETIRAADETLQITVYSGHLIKEQLGNGYDDVLTTTSLWLAHYTTGTPTWPQNTWPVWSLWQFTDRANVPGIDSLCDGDRFNGTVDQCLAWFGPAGTLPEPQPEPDDDQPEVVVDITATDGVKVTVLVNGDPR